MGQKTNASFLRDGYCEYLTIHKDPFNDKLSDPFTLELSKGIWSKSYKLWQDKPDEISNRLGWLELPNFMTSVTDSIDEFSHQIVSSGFTDVLVIGMGGSSLASEFFEKTFSLERKLSLTVVDTTDPEAIRAFVGSVNPEKTLIVVSTKSGTTAETISLMRYFYRKFCEKLGENRAGDNFVAITDPGSDLEKIAKMLDFRRIFLGLPDVGGRFSALSPFGLVPASLIGMNVKKLLKAAKGCAELTKLNDINKNFPLRLGLLMGYFVEQKIDKMTIVASKNARYFAYWVEQLVAESIGKEGTGILPVIQESIYDNVEYGEDRFFVFLKMKGDEDLQTEVELALDKNIPTVCMEIDGFYGFGDQLFGWEFATAVCGAALKINPFDQPDVEYSKKHARNFVNEYLKSKSMPELDPLFEYDCLRFFCNSNFRDVKGFREWLFQKASKGRYVAIQAFLTPSDENEKMLKDLVENLSAKLRVPVTFGFGPRYLHSTGQMHKGDSGNGVFIQLVSKSINDVSIPDDPFSDKSSLGFGVLKNAQSLGDYLALKDKGRDIARIDLGDHTREGLTILTGFI